MTAPLPARLLAYAQQQEDVRNALGIDADDYVDQQEIDDLREAAAALSGREGREAVAIVPKHSQMEAAVDAYLAEQEQGGSLHACVFEACDAFVKATPSAPVDVRVVEDPSGFSAEMVLDEANNWTARYTGAEMLRNYAALLDGQQAGVDANYHVRAHSDRVLGEAGWMVLDDPVGFMRYPANFDYRVTYTAALGGGGRGK